MQLVCPNCEAIYNISSRALGSEGKKVRCVRCTSEWFAEVKASGEGNNNAEFKLPEGLDAPVDIEDEFEETADISQMIPPVAQLDTDDEGEEEQSEEASAETNDEETSEDRARENIEDDIPDAVKPKPNDKKTRPVKIKTPVPMAAKMAGYGAALCILIIIFAAGFIFKNDIVKAWPPSAAIYDIAGTPVSFKGEGLIVESLSANVITNNNQQDVLVLEGRVINLTGETIAVPPMLAKLRTTNGEAGEGWIIDPPVEEIEPGDSFAFKSDYPSLPRGIGSVNLTFVPTLL